VKLLVYAGLVFGLVPVQVSLLPSLSIGGVRPDLCLIAACLVGILGGAVDGLLVGLALGYVQALFSAGELWLGLATKGLIGLLAGLAGRRLTHAAPTSMLGLLGGLSVLSGLVFLFTTRAGGGLMDHFFTLWAVLLPEVAFNVAIGMGTYWLLAGHTQVEQDIRRVPPGFIR
jgi:hypothetical protein